MRRLARAALCALAVASPALARADAIPADDFDADRPDVSESPRALETGRWQLEAGGSAAVVLDGGDSHSTIGEGLLRWGVVRHLELRATLPSWNEFVPGSGFMTVALAGGARPGSLSGLGDAGLGFKATLPGSDEEYAAGLVFDLSLPTGSRAFGSRTAGFESELAVSRSAGEASLTVNGLWFHADGEEVVGASASLELDLARRWGVYFEGVGTYGPALRTNGFLFDAGTTWRVAHWTQLDLHGGVGSLAPDDAALSLGAGVTRRW